MRLILITAITAVIAATSSFSAPLQGRDTTFVGYFVTHFLGNDEAIYQRVSNGNNAYSFTSLNNGNAVLRSNVGIEGVRDPYLVASPERTEFWTLATDLQIGKTNFDEALARGSRSIVIWHSTNLVDWDANYLVEVEIPEAGMVWAPSAVWDPSSSQYFVFWSSQFYAEDDPNHNGSATSKPIIRYATTKDFKSFSVPKDYAKGDDQLRLDQEFQLIDGDKTFARFMCDDTHIFQEVSYDGLFGNWQRINGVDGHINDELREGAASFRDNQDPNKFHLWLDNYTGDGYQAYATSDIFTGYYSHDSVDGFPSNMRHGSVLPITQSEYDTIRSRLGN
ncbi:endo-1,4-beta-xylanase [Meira miltonrushii]|uniref:Endo-1,4-beta-xylanase n=1 Tax=Meira miltonrushii TaxID=1280837 RepID=A0A316VBR7_9BASI|nr:endo-1,4-beta-xylanase [Meira miltonrushii]PWN34976.1 endo-1,4-beta-xylanase [Meira miltonrushii]